MRYRGVSIALAVVVLMPVVSGLLGLILLTNNALVRSAIVSQRVSVLENQRVAEVVRASMADGLLEVENMGTREVRIRLAHVIDASGGRTDVPLDVRVKPGGRASVALNAPDTSMVLLVTESGVVVPVEKKANPGGGSRGFIETYPPDSEGAPRDLRLRGLAGGCYAVLYIGSPTTEFWCNGSLSWWVELPQPGPMVVVEETLWVYSTGSAAYLYDKGFRLPYEFDLTHLGDRVWWFKPGPGEAWGVGVDTGTGDAKALVVGGRGGFTASIGSLNPGFLGTPGAGYSGESLLLFPDVVRVAGENLVRVRLLVAKRSQDGFSSNYLVVAEHPYREDWRLLPLMEVSTVDLITIKRYALLRYILLYGDWSGNYRWFYVVSFVDLGSGESLVVSTRDCLKYYPPGSVVPIKRCSPVPQEERDLFVDPDATFLNPGAPGATTVRVFVSSNGAWMVVRDWSISPGGGLVLESEAEYWFSYIPVDSLAQDLLGARASSFRGSRAVRLPGGGFASLTSGGFEVFYPNGTSYLIPAPAEVNHPERALMLTPKRAVYITPTGRPGEYGLKEVGVG